MRVTQRLQVTPSIADGQNRRVTCATVCHTPGGDLLCAWYGGPSRPEAGTVDPCGLVYLSRLSRGADAWTEPAVLADSPKGTAVLDPVLFEYPAGTITAIRSLQTHCRWGQVGGAFIHLNRSTDEGRTWSESALLEALPAARTKNQPFVEGATCVLPVALELGVEVPPGAYYLRSVPHFRDVAVVISTDEGLTWRRTALLQAADGTRLMEPTTVKLSDGRLLMYLRSAPPGNDLRWPNGRPGRIWQSTSRDGGLSWTEPERTELPNNNSGFDMCRAPDGRLFLAYNNHCRLGENVANLLNNRYPLVLAESRDEGATWRDVITLDPGPGFEVSYASIICDPGGLLHCVYTWDRRAIKYVRIDPEA